MSEYLNEMIGYQVEGTAEWRREKAMQFPNDARNLRAAEELGRLAAEIDALRDSEVEKQISEAHQTLNDAINGEVWMDLNETVSAELREIGFHKGHVTTTELLEWYRDLLRGKRDDLIETAKREEAAEADPAVGAAKAALDNAKAALERAQADLNAVQDLAYAKLLRRQRLRVLSDN